MKPIFRFKNQVVNKLIYVREPKFIFNYHSEEESINDKYWKNWNDLLLEFEREIYQISRTSDDDTKRSFFLELHENIVDFKLFEMAKEDIFASVDEWNNDESKRTRDLGNGCSVIYSPIAREELDMYFEKLNDVTISFQEIVNNSSFYQSVLIKKGNSLKNNIQPHPYFDKNILPDLTKFAARYLSKPDLVLFKNLLNGRLIDKKIHFRESSIYFVFIIKTIFDSHGISGISKFRLSHWICNHFSYLDKKTNAENDFKFEYVKKILSGQQEISKSSRPNLQKLLSKISG